MEVDMLRIFAKSTVEKKPVVSVTDEVTRYKLMQAEIARRQQKAAPDAKAVRDENNRIWAGR